MQRPHQLLDEKRVTLGERVDLLEEIPPRRAAETQSSPQHSVDVDGLEWGQPKLAGQSLALEAFEQLAQCTMNLVRAIGQQQQDPSASERPSEAVQQVEAGVIGPVHVLDDQQRGRPVSSLAEDLANHLEKAPAILLGIGPHRFAVRRQQAGELREHP